ncbi:MAG: orotidine-5'-phosphate decarboxylase [Candidatus Vogelbacteria bacterium]|nr:orotidine-5'-phosphate decarboxylase [Candidatus Vogelbacteria bacterium]
MRNFIQLIKSRWEEEKFVCVGLDSDYEKIPNCLKRTVRGLASHSKIIFRFNRDIIDATKDLVCAYKPNSAFYEAYGDEGIKALKKTCDYILKTAPTVPIILDAKRGDIGRTNEMYAKFAFDWLRADAITVNPYLGGKSLSNFLNRKDRGIIILCKTSNEGSNEFQKNLYKKVAKNVVEKWNKNSNCLLVAGATYPRELKEIRKIVGDLPLLIPGIGKQGGDLEAVIKNGQDSKGQGMIINSSSGIIFASSGKDFAEAARNETLKLHEAISKLI